MKNVITQVVKRGLCCGCGICVSASKKDCLEIIFNKCGELIPAASRCDSCELCLSVCPFAPDIVDKPVSSLGNYVGYSNISGERPRASSGGLATRLLKSLLERKVVDSVIIIGHSKKEDRFFEPFIARTTQEVDVCTGSKYYPVEFSSVLKTLKEEDTQCAIIALPCVIRGLHLLRKNYPVIGKKIKYLFCLICGHNTNKNYSSFLLGLAGVKGEDVRTIDFRSKEEIKTANNFGFRGILKTGTATKQLNFQETLVKDLFTKRYFSLNACFYCKDVFAEYADASFMDAWLKPYIDDPAGTSIVVVRNEDIKKIITEEARTGNITIDAISQEKVIESQDCAIDFKAKDIKGKWILLFNRLLSNKLYSEGRTKKTDALAAYILAIRKFGRLKTVVSGTKKLLVKMKKTLLASKEKR